jgi:hypothetical protein
MKIGLLFPDGFRGGLRGDKQLYDWLKKEIDPDLEMTTKDEFISYIINLIKTKLKVDITSREKRILKIPELYKGGPGHGMSTGVITPINWQEYHLPHLAKPLEEN